MANLPNILLFLTDDHAAWCLRSYGNSEVRTPHLDALAQAGIRFQNAFAPCPVCSPARACVMTGRTPSQVGCHDWLEESIDTITARDWIASEATLPRLLSQAGYWCALSGKWHLGHSRRTPAGFQTCFGLPGWQGSHNGSYTYHFDGKPLTLEGNKTRLITDYAIRLLDTAPKDKPFFLNVGYIATHSPWKEQDPLLVSSYSDCTFDDVPAHDPHPLRKNEGFPMRDEVTDAERREAHAHYYAAVTDIDMQVGRILGHLEKQKRLEDTLFIYTSDHGLSLGQNGVFGKGNGTRPLNMYEPNIRVPLILRFPGRQHAGTTVQNCVDHYDLYQSLAALCGLQTDPSRNYPGRSFLPLLSETSGTPDWDDTRYGEYGDLRMIRTPQWKLVRRYHSGADDLFHLAEDPEEHHNLAADVSRQTVFSGLLNRLEEWYARHEHPHTSGLRVKELPRHNSQYEAWRDGLREQFLTERNP